MQIEIDIKFSNEAEEENVKINIQKIVKKYPGILKRNKFVAKNIKLRYDGELEERMVQFWEELLRYEGKYTRKMLEDFYIWWSEPTQDLKPKMKWETQDTWRTAGRLALWNRRSFNNGK